MRWVRAGLLAAPCAAATIALGATGAFSSAAAATTSAPAASAAATATIAASTVAYGVRYTGGKAGKANPALSPVTIGFTTMMGGTPSFPELVAAANATTSFINGHLSGIGGHPLKLATCFIQSEEDGQKCAADFLAKKVAVVNQGLAVIGNASLYKTLGAKIPVLIGTTSAAQDYTAPGAYSYTGGGPAVIFAMAKDSANLHAKYVALLSVNNPGGKFTMQQIAEPALNQLGVKHSQTVYYPQASTTPDIVSALQAAGGSKADVIFFDPSGPQECISLYNALKQLGIKKPVESTPICNAPAFINQTGGGPANWRFWGFNTNPRVTSDPQVQVFNNIMAAYGQSSYADVGFATSTTRDLLTLAKFGNQLGASKITATTMAQKIKGFAGPAFLTPGPLTCSSPPTPASPTVCGAESVGSAFIGGKWVNIAPIKVALKK
jgi:branched-chain amino acid transport system substrate-binding protein